MKLWCLCQLIANVAIIYVRSLQNNIEGLIHDKIEQNIDNNLVKHVTFDYPTIPIEEQRTKMYETTKSELTEEGKEKDNRLESIHAYDSFYHASYIMIFHFTDSSTTELKNRNPGKRLTHIH
ncbi:hypothetical protein KSF78_0008843 [Schistosoma japonicum]|nr:hypothetical protein KSF78_0008843 [Schistosoma japonicum]